MLTTHALQGPQDFVLPNPYSLTNYDPCYSYDAAVQAGASSATLATLKQQCRTTSYAHVVTHENLIAEQNKTTFLGISPESIPDYVSEKNPSDPAAQQAIDDAAASRATMIKIGVGVGIAALVVAAAYYGMKREPGSYRSHRGVKRGERFCKNGVRYQVKSGGRVARVGNC
jgi:hypothetical protein